MIVLLKSFQRLGYFPHSEFIHVSVLTHLRSYPKLNSWVSAVPTLPTRYRYQQAIRAYLNVKPYNREAQKLVAGVIALNQGTLRIACFQHA